MNMLTLMALACSSLALFGACRLNPKRRRSLKQPACQHPWQAPFCWWLALLPGVLLIAASEITALIAWFAAMSVFGWSIALFCPGGIVDRNSR